MIFISYVILRTDKASFRLAKEIDEKYYETFKEVTALGVEVLVYQSEINHQEINIKTKVQRELT